MSNINKPLSKKSATLLGVGLSAFGSMLIVFTAFQLESFAHTFIIILAAGILSCGTWVSTVAKAMKETDSVEPNESNSHE